MIPGSHLERLYHLRRRINDEIRMEEARARTESPGTKATVGPVIVDVPSELRQGAASPNRRTTALASRITGDLARLRDRLTDERTRRQAAAQRAAEKALEREARAAERRAGKVARRNAPVLPLEERIARLSVSTRHIKQWAVDQGLIREVKRGRIRADLVDAYEQAHPTEEEKAS